LEAKTKEFTQALTAKSQELYEKEVENENALQMLAEHEVMKIFISLKFV
jgi:hypothetical protein